MECEVCFKEWDTSKHMPLILQCGHTFCKECLSAQVNQKKKILCPKCKKEFIIEDINKLQKNKSLMKLYDKVELSKSNVFNMSMSFASSYNDTNNNTSMNNSNLFSNGSGQNLNYFPLCKPHKNKALYYFDDGGSKIFYCEKCINEIYPEDYNPIPSLREDNFSKLDSCLSKTKIIKNEIDRIEEFLNSYMNNFSVNNMSKIDELFEYMNKIIQYGYTTAKTLYDQCKNEQKNQIDKKVSELHTLRKELDQFEKNIKFLYKQNTKDDLSFEHQSTLNSLFSKLSNYLNYESELNLFQMKIEEKSEMRESLFDLIQNSYDIDVDFLKMKNGDMPTIKELLNKENNWQCSCGFFDNPNTTVKCSECGRYRKLESYDNVIFKPMKISSFELTQLSMRRKDEIKTFQNLLKNDTKEKYALHTNWFLSWKCFVTNDLSEKYIKNENKKISENKLIGVLPPGCISNGNIAEKKNNGFVVRGSLKEKDNYLLVNKNIWDFFLLNYEGGPELKVKCKVADESMVSNEGKSELSDKFEVSPNATPNMFSEGKFGKKFDPNATALGETVHRIAPIGNYNFSTKFSEFKATSTPEKISERDSETNGTSEEKMKNLFDNISIKDIPSN